MNLDGPLDEFGATSTGLICEFHLRDVPDESTLDVWVDESGALYDFSRGDDVTWDPVANSVRFVDYLPPPDARVFVEYRPLRH